eukprot:scaffold1328_cov162-Amphora_coffeaeformis.AAC.27
MADDLEEIFQSIEQGNHLRDEKKYWEAATAYTKARRTLVDLVQQQDGDAQIRELYARQARDYLHRARETLLDALRQEDEADRKVKLGDFTQYERIAEKDDEACLERLRLFAWLFSNEKVLSIGTTAKDGPVEGHQLSLEDRFRALNASLPSSVKTNDERMKDINKGLRNLGISVPSSSTSKAQELFEANAKSDGEQVEDIIAQAKDEALLGGHKNVLSSSSVPSSATSDDEGGTGDTADKLINSMMDTVAAATAMGYRDDDDDDDDSPSQEEGETGDGNDGPFLSSDLAYFQDRVNEAQAALAELNAMLDVEEDEDADLLFDAETGKHALDQALQHLQQVKKRWKEAKKRS